MNTKMKVLSLALVGLCGYAGSAMAVCPNGPAIVDGGAWSSSTVSSDATIAITSPGLDSTACKLSLTLTAGSVSNAKAFASDTSPANEARYRARFYLDLSALTGLTLSNQQTKILNTFAATSPANLSTDEVVVRLVGGSPASIRFSVADSLAPGGFHTITAALPTSANSNYRIEFDLVQGTTSSTPAGSFRYWVTDAAAASSDSTPDGSYPVGDNTGWSGADQTNLGVYSTSAGYRTATAGQALSVDEFDSRRSTFIGQ